MESPQTGGRTAQEARVKRDGLASSGKAPLQLTGEEKAVLMECRRNSTARGLAVTAGSLVLLRALIGSGRLPLHIQRWSSLYYTAVGAASFLAGLRSYRQTCLDKIMSLENSLLADQLRQHRRKQQGWTEEDGLPSLMRDSPPPLTSSPLPLSQPNTVTSDTPFSSDPADQQPDAFGPTSLPPPPLPGDYDNSSSKIRGRTFDEIRDENRRRQQQRHYPQSRVGGVRGEDAGNKPVHVRRNKYGDIISEE
ncbi:OCIA domain-containing protein 1 [Geodia barretti]|uniref:OCIA domain-containing protein 1 n=1 Tax=Geodia barretti TaxID=519541 RepID=A0AA35T2A0_GEOBA|nr:OCIA domain-containing protein 1 [Geodia barretti]